MRGSIVTATDHVDFEIRPAAAIASGLATEVAADEADIRAFEYDLAAGLAVESGVAAVAVKLETEADQDRAARSRASIFARPQPCRRRRPGHTGEAGHDQQRHRPQREICHALPPFCGRKIAAK